MTFGLCSLSAGQKVAYNDDLWKGTVRVLANSNPYENSLVVDSEGTVRAPTIKGERNQIQLWSFAELE